MLIKKQSGVIVNRIMCLGIDVDTALGIDVDIALGIDVDIALGILNLIGIPPQKIRLKNQELLLWN